MDQHIGETDLQAYIDGQLDVADRVRVEARLQADLEAAALAMEGLRQRDEIRLFMADAGPGAPPATLALAQRLERQLGWRAMALRWRRGLVAACLVGLGWLAHAEFGVIVDRVSAAHAPPAYADEAVVVSRAARQVLAHDRVPEPALLPLPARDGGLVHVPELPGGLSFVGSELVPWKGGDALLALYRTGDGGMVTLFATDPGTFDVVAPQLGSVRGAPTVFWQDGHSAYALNGDLPEARLLAIARQAAPWR